jgi:hypothetical protein
MEDLVMNQLPVGTVAIVSVIFLGNILPLAMMWGVYRHAEKKHRLPLAIAHARPSVTQKIRIPRQAA